MLHFFLKITGIVLMAFQSTIYTMENQLPKNVPAHGNIDEAAIHQKLDPIFKDFTQLETNRLIIRKFRKTDLDDFFEIEGDPEVNKYESVPKVPNKQEVEAELNTILSNYDKNIPTFWAIEHRENGKVIGLCGFNQWLVCFYQTSLGYSINRKYWDQDICTEAARAVVDFAFNTGLLNRIEAKCNPLNGRSVSVLQKLKMRLEGVSEQRLWNMNGPFDAAIYGLLYSRWLENKQNTQKNDAPVAQLDRAVDS